MLKRRKGPGRLVLFGESRRRLSSLEGMPYLRGLCRPGKAYEDVRVAGRNQYTGISFFVLRPFVPEPSTLGPHVSPSGHRDWLDHRGNARHAGRVYTLGIVSVRLTDERISSPVKVRPPRATAPCVRQSARSRHDVRSARSVRSG